ncbi:hypothetical protein C8J57DRAFT_1246535 [Mycena rebaudengoi]|nr:hypothetical protein C8J57DRAFT_1246535 [Mycena rebaudengoi]
MSADICAANRNAINITTEDLDPFHVQTWLEGPLVFGRTGVETYAHYTLQVGRLLSKPNAGVFIMARGFTSWIALTFELDVLRKLMNGPSTQVTEYYRGWVHADKRSPSRGDFTRDQFSLDKESILYGLIRSVMTAGCHAIFTNLIADIRKGNARWRMEGQWAKYLKAGNRGEHTPKFIPKDSDFAQGVALIKWGFRVNWNGEFLRDLKVPDVFVPLTAEE